MANCVRCKKVLDDGLANCDFCGISQRGGSPPATPKAAAPQARQKEFPATPPQQQQQRPPQQPQQRSQKQQRKQAAQREQQQRAQPQQAQPRPTPKKASGGGGKVFLFILIVAGVMAVTKMSEINAWWKVKNWRAGRTLYCSGSDKMTIRHRTVSMRGDVAIHASGKCRLTLTDVKIENAQTAIMATGQARVTLVDSTMLASGTAITAMDTARVSVVRGRLVAPIVANANATRGVIEIGVGTVTDGEISSSNGGRVLDQR